MKPLLVLLGVLLWVAAPCVAQRYKHFNLNAGVTASTADKQAVLALWDTYLGSGFDKQAQFWSPTDLQQYAKGDLLLSEGYVNPNVYHYSTEKLVLSVEKLDTNRYQCKTLFYWHNPTDSLQKTTVFCLVNMHFLRQQQRWFLSNSLAYTTRSWTTETQGYLTYKLPPNWPLDRQKAAVAAAFLMSLFRDFAITPFQVTYYLAATCQQAQQLKGFDYVVGMGNDTVCGFYDEVNHLVYAGGLGGAYLHELVHVINPYFPKAHPLFLTGYSALCGGHFGHDLAYHKQRVQTYLATHSVDLTNPLQFTSLDEKTNPQYVIGSIFCERALKQGGLAKLKRLFSYGTSDEAFFVAIKQEFRLSRKQLPEFIKQQLQLRAH